MVRRILRLEAEEEVFGLGAGPENLGHGNIGVAHLEILAEGQIDGIQVFPVHIESERHREAIIELILPPRLPKREVPIGSPTQPQ
jgi:hypothetical protein